MAAPPPQPCGSQHPPPRPLRLAFRSTEKSTLLLGKALHFLLLLLLPRAAHGSLAALLGAAGYSTTMSIILATVFFVSHNVEASKPLEAGSDDTRAVLHGDVAARDWGVQQVRASGCDAGGVGQAPP